MTKGMSVADGFHGLPVIAGDLIVGAERRLAARSSPLPRLIHNRTRQRTHGCEPGCGNANDHRQLAHAIDETGRDLQSTHPVPASAPRP